MHYAMDFFVAGYSAGKSLSGSDLHFDLSVFGYADYASLCRPRV